MVWQPTTAAGLAVVRVSAGVRDRASASERPSDGAWSSRWNLMYPGELAAGGEDVASDLRDAGDDVQAISLFDGLQEQRSAVFVILFALITILILYSSNSANEVFHYGSLRGRSRRPVNLKKWSITDGYIPILGNKTLPSRCHQCVIISSSSHLLGTKLGPEIERAECTIRMNDAPTTGYSADVGNKTTFRVVAHSSVFRVLRRPQEFVNRTPETVFIFWGPPSKMQKPQGSLVRVIQRAGLAFPTMEAYAISPARMHQFDDLFRGETGKDREKSHSWLSTGWFTMVIAVELCDHVHVYGMVPPDYCSQRSRPQRMPYHYYEPKGPDECVTYIQNEHSRKGNHHRFITEKRVFSSWAQLYGITFSHPSWT
ncbi:Alpha-N-acetylgalactosaminide alpha-2,6-sialyltransferase 6 [Tupaia chinensis]|uniref:Alpha-N-acetylgalactosaminide alpha-2,6-sialyltransferase 6 n=1 Tax=Tupaia chinensis TaxID=246437 RepID=L9KLM3_TUPCH|nr:Alpha-N-acetylgalactosaminide alpha-2,6-sialyltransferase 6 [Tupaia chinensis]